MAVYSLNLTLLALACDEPLRASELFPQEPDPAASLRNTGLTWRGAFGRGLWIEVAAALTITRTWTDGIRDMVLTIGSGRGVEPVDPLWSHGRTSGPERTGELITDFRLEPALTSMQLTNNLSDDALRHALQPLMDRMPETLTHFVVQAPGDVESVAHSLMALWLTSTLSEDPRELVRAYERAVLGVSGSGWDGETKQAHIESAIAVLLKTMARDVDRLPPAEVIRWLDSLGRSRFFSPANSRLALDCLNELPAVPETNEPVLLRVYFAASASTLDEREDAETPDDPDGRHGSGAATRAPQPTPEAEDSVEEPAEGSAEGSAEVSEPG